MSGCSASPEGAASGTSASFARDKNAPSVDSVTRPPRSPPGFYSVFCATGLAGELLDPVVRASTVLRSQKGFTMMELMVIITMMMILARITYPRMATLMGTYRLETAGRNLAAELQKARFRAIAESTCYKVVFDGTAKTYKFQKLSTGLCTAAGTYVDDGVAKPIESSNSISVSATQSPIFTSRGSLVTGTQTTITLTGFNSWRHLVAVDITGRVSVKGGA
jgi:Tfp pilus assembly protein FimT